MFLNKYYSDDQIKNQMGGACSIYGEKQRCIHGFGGETCKQEASRKAET